MTTEPIRAPWTADQVTALNAFQHYGRMHPFTCGALHESGQSPILVATYSGWTCPDPQCTFRQDWAHAFMIERGASAVPVPPPADQTAEELPPAATCSAQNRNYESGPRLCIRAAQHHGDHIDERGFHWSDTVAVYPASDGTFRRGTDVRAPLRRVAAEEQPAETPMFGSPDCTCIPFTRQGGAPRYCGPTDTVDMISGWEIGRDCPHHKPAVGEQPETQEARHLGGRANAEDCPACEGTNPPYPFLCPGPDAP